MKFPSPVSANWIAEFINAKILEKLSRFWQNMFLSVGIIIAVFGMRIVFPIAIVALTANFWFISPNTPSRIANKRLRI